MPLCCVECKPCHGPGALFIKSRRRPGPAQQLRRAFGKMKLGGGTLRRRPRRPGSFSSVRAVFWPLISMRSSDAAADARNDNDDDARPPPDSSSSPDVSVSASASVSFSRGAPPPPPPSMKTQDDGGVGAPGGDASSSSAAPLVEAAAAGGDEEAKALIVVARHGGGEVEAACRRFERQLMEMVVEEGQVMDLTDVEDLLSCWEKLRCPALVGLVGRFYGELCLDLFSSSAHEDDADEAFLP